MLILYIIENVDSSVVLFNKTTMATYLKFNLIQRKYIKK